jgi:hypothetical protein
MYASFFLTTENLYVQNGGMSGRVVLVASSGGETIRGGAPDVKSGEVGDIYDGSVCGS